MIDEMIAHVRKREDGSWDEPHKLSEHLNKTAEIAEMNAAKFNSGIWGKVLGYAHDAGKGRQEWQTYVISHDRLQKHMWHGKSQERLGNPRKTRDSSLS